MSLAEVLSGHRPWHVEPGDVRAVLRQLPEESVHCVVSSPPYWGLRDYGVEGQMGLEASFDDWLAAMVGVFREVRRVLRRDGTCWVNMGDSYVGSRCGAGGETGASGLQGSGTSQEESKRAKQAMTASRRRDDLPVPRSDRPVEGLKPKDMVGQPWRLAFALQDDGWWLRSDVIWHKPNAMPESITDRPAKEHEYVFLLAKSQRYFYDAEAVAEPTSGTAHPRGKGTTAKGALAWPGIGPKHAAERDRGEKSEPMAPRVRPRQNNSFQEATTDLVAIRNKRTVWRIPTQPFPEAHFATFPEALVEPCIKAGTSERGCCAHCGAPWRRQMTRPTYGDTNRRDERDPRVRLNSGGGSAWRSYERPETTGWEPGCKCDGGGPPVPCVVLDPFAGSGTVAVVALRLRRRFVGAELNPEYVRLAKERIAGGAESLSRWGGGAGE